MERAHARFAVTFSFLVTFWGTKGEKACFCAGMLPRDELYEKNEKSGANVNKALKDAFGSERGCVEKEGRFLCSMYRENGVRQEKEWGDERGKCPPNEVNKIYLWANEKNDLAIFNEKEG